MKKAVIVVGSHFAGKSKTIRLYFKPLVGISQKARNFQLGQYFGVALSQSLEERPSNGRVLSQSLEERENSDVGDYVARYEYFELLVLAARPSGESKSHYLQLKSELEGRGFSVGTVNVVKDQSESFYAERAHEILSHLP